MSAHNKQTQIHTWDAYRVPNLQLDLLVLNVDHPRAKLDADRQVVHRLEALVRELQQQTRLPDACAHPYQSQHHTTALSFPPRSLCASADPLVPVSPMIMYLNRYAYDISTGGWLLPQQPSQLVKAAPASITDGSLAAQSSPSFSHIGTTKLRPLPEPETLSSSPH